jgi:RNA polymerase sporulation-specific sigma factor
MKKEEKDETGLGRHPEASEYEQAQAGYRESLNQLMKRHEPLVLHAVKRQNLGDLAYDEVVQAGRIGLWQAIMKYDAGRGHQFSTYAYAAIVHQVWAAVKAHCVANGKEHATREWAIFFRHWEAGPAQQQAEREVRASLQAMVMHLQELMQQVIRVRYEMGGKKWKTYEEIGKELGFSGEWVRQLEIEGMVWLRHPAHSQELRALLRRHSQQEYEWAEEIAQAWLRRRGGRHG